MSELVVASTDLSKDWETVKFLDVHNNTRLVPIIRYEPIVWISVTVRDSKVKTLPNDAVRVPAILDTGCTISSLLHRWHLESWFGITSNEAAESKAWMVFDQKVASVALDVWLHYSIDSPAFNAKKMRFSIGVGVGQIRINADSIPIEVSKRKKTERRKVEVQDVEAVESWVQDIRLNSGIKSDIPRFIHPRLPLLGMPFLMDNQLSLKVMDFKLILSKQISDPSEAELGRKPR